MKEVGKLGVPVLSRVVPAVDPITKLVFPHLSDEQRAAFNQQVMKDLENPEYRHYIKVYYFIQESTDVLVVVLQHVSRLRN